MFLDVEVNVTGWYGGLGFGLGFYELYIYIYLQPSAFRRPSSLLPVCRLQKAFVSKMSL